MKYRLQRSGRVLYENVPRRNVMHSKNIVTLYQEFEFVLSINDQGLNIYYFRKKNN